jgi:hypothetical protein
MKKTIIITCLVILGMVIFIKSGMLDSLILFLLVGVVPGTNYVVPSNVMLIAIFSIVWLLIVRFAAIEVFNFFMDKRMTAPKDSHKKRMPKRRYSQI